MLLNILLGPEDTTYKDLELKNLFKIWIVYIIAAQRSVVYNSSAFYLFLSFFLWGWLGVVLLCVFVEVLKRSYGTKFFIRWSIDWAWTLSVSIGQMKMRPQIWTSRLGWEMQGRLDLPYLGHNASIHELFFVMHEKVWFAKCIKVLLIYLLIIL